MKACVRLLIVLLSLFGASTAFSQANYTLSGSVRDASTGETLSGASVEVVGGKAQALSNDYGFFSMRVAAGSYELRVSYVGYQSHTRQLRLDGDTSVTFALEPGSLLEAVEISSVPQTQNLTTAMMGTNQFQVRDIEKVPVLFGEKDVLKTLQLLPGVLSGGEGSSGFFVRGGAADQNLIILDEAIVYNASHLLGFFSTFNSDAIKDMTLYKGGMPAEYGGRLASVLDISMLEGNKKEFRVKGGVGLIASRIAVEGPLKKDKGSFMLSGRRTYADVFLKLSGDSTISNSSLYFYDLNLKANYQFNDRNTLYLSGYSGKDLLAYSGSFGFDWGNTTASARWNHVFSPALFSNTSLIYGGFDYHVDIFEKEANFTIASLVRNYQLRQDFQYYPGNGHVVKFGAGALRQRVSPADFQSRDTSSFNSLASEARNGLELNAYVSHDWKVSDRFNVLYGLRLSLFRAMGPGTFNRYDPDGEISETVFLPDAGLVKQYFNPEPRLSLNYRLSELTSLKVSYNRNSQNLHLLSNSSASLPTDVWMMSSQNIRPQLADQLALGYFRNLRENQYEFSAEVYYKTMQNQIDFRVNADIQANPNVEADLLYGDGRAYGLELFLKKRTGRLTGWLSYTLSRSERQFEEIDAGRWFPARQDRTHDLSLVGMYEISDRWTFSGTFVYSTGNAVTFPSGKYTVNEKPVWYYSERNGYRMPAYHRMDIGFTYEPPAKGKLVSTWDFSLYNAYNHKNAYIIDFRESEANPNISEAYKTSLFGIIPSVTWNFKF
jgi:hypothetical protein